MSDRKPLVIDLFTGLHGWASGFVAEGWEIFGFDLEDMCAQFSQARPEHVHLVIQDVLTLHGSQFRNADLIVASPPCTEYSYMAMPWTRAKQIALALRGEGEFPEGYRGSRTIPELNALFDACFRIQREACEVAGRHIPLIVENVKGAQPWVGRARYNFGSFYLWGDVPALMPPTVRAQKNPGFRFDGSGRSFQSESVEQHTEFNGYKSQGMNWSDRSKHGQDFTRVAGRQAHTKNDGGSWFAIGSPGQKVTGQNPDGRKLQKPNGGSWFYEYGPGQGSRNTSSNSAARKFASAMIAKIPLPLSTHIARIFKSAGPVGKALSFVEILDTGSQ